MLQTSDLSENISKSNRKRFPLIGRGKQTSRNFGEEMGQTSVGKQEAWSGCGQALVLLRLGANSSGAWEEEKPWLRFDQAKAEGN